MHEHISTSVSQPAWRPLLQKATGSRTHPRCPQGMMASCAQRDDKAETPLLSPSHTRHARRLVPCSTRETLAPGADASAGKSEHREECIPSGDVHTHIAGTNAPPFIQNNARAALRQSRQGVVCLPL